MINIAVSPVETKLEEVFRRTLPKLGPEARNQLEAIINPTSLAIIAGVLVAWVVSHAFGIGEVIDILIAALGVVSIGWALFTGLDHLYDFAVGTYRARDSRDLDAAADNLAKAIAIVGIQAVLALLCSAGRRPLAPGAAGASTLARHQPRPAYGTSPRSPPIPRFQQGKV